MASFQELLDKLQAEVMKKYPDCKMLEWDLNSDEEKAREKLFTPGMNEFRRKLGVAWHRAWVDAEGTRVEQDPSRKGNLYSVTDQAIKMEKGYSYADLEKILSPYIMQIRQVAIDNRQIKDEAWIRENDAVRLANYGGKKPTSRPGYTKSPSRQWSRLEQQQRSEAGL